MRETLDPNRTAACKYLGIRTGKQQRLREAGATVQRSDIQGMRAIAVLSVIVYHIDKEWLPGGFAGVDMFFVISGYLITSLILSRRAVGHFSFAEFYYGRVRRIVPAYLVMLAFTSLFAAILFTPNDFLTFRKSLEAALVFSSNHHFAAQSDYFAPSSFELPLLHTWSLAVEMQFYLLLPVVVVLLRPHHLTYALSIVLFAALAIFELSTDTGHGTEIYFLLWPRVPEFLAGSLLAALPISVGQRQKSRIDVVAVFGFILLFGSAFLLSDDSIFPGVRALPVVIGTACLIASQGSTINSLLSTRPFVWIGDISYSLYLWHWPVLAITRYTTGNYTIPLEWVPIALAATLIFSFISYRLVENPFRVRDAALGPPVGVMALVFLVLAASFGSSHLNKQLDPELPTSLTRYASPDEICHGQIIGNCARGASEASVSIFLIGDSHAAQLNRFADVIGESLGAQFKVITASSCIPIPDFDVERIATWAQAPCRSQAIEVERMLSEVDAVVLAGKWSYHTASPVFREALYGFLEQVTGNGTPLLVLAQLPQLDRDPQRTLRLWNLGLPTSVGLDEDWLVGGNQLERILASFPNATYLDASKLPLFSNAPFFDGRPIYFDSHHLNEYGSESYARQALPFIRIWIDALAGAQPTIR